MDRNTRIATLALFIALATALHWAESFIPRPAPFLRFGLANIFTLCAIYMFGGVWGIIVLISRVIIGSTLSGSIFTPAFFFSLSGGLASGIVMWIMPKRFFSPIGVSVTGACVHMTTQLLLAGIIIRHFSFMNLFPLFIFISVLTGTINGYCVKIIVDVAEKKRYLISDK